VDYETFQDDWELPEGHPEATVEVSHAYLKTFSRPFLAVKIVQFWHVLALRWEASAGRPKQPDGSITMTIFGKNMTENTAKRTRLGGKYAWIRMCIPTGQFHRVKVWNPSYVK
jgi:hypothetical protein